MSKTSFHIRYVDDETKAWLKAYAREHNMLLAGALRKIMEIVRAENPSPSAAIASRPQEHRTEGDASGQPSK